MRELRKLIDSIWRSVEFWRTMAFLYVGIFIAGLVWK